MGKYYDRKSYVNIKYVKRGSAVSTEEKSDIHKTEITPNLERAWKTHIGFYVLLCSVYFLSAKK